MLTYIQLLNQFREPSETEYFKYEEMSLDDLKNKADEYYASDYYLSNRREALQRYIKEKTKKEMIIEVINKTVRTDIFDTKMPGWKLIDMIIHQDISHLTTITPPPSGIPPGGKSEITTGLRRSLKTFKINPTKFSFPKAKTIQEFNVQKDTYKNTLGCH